MAKILVVDDEQSMREFLEILLRKQGHEVVAAATLGAALACAAEGDLDLVLSDLRLGAESGIQLLEAVKREAPGTEVIILTAFATTENAIQAMKLGAYDYVLKPFKVEELKLVIEKALEHRGLVAENRVLRHRVGRRGDDGQDAELIGRSPAIEEVRALVEKLARTRTTVLISGESGTGKEVVARTIHARAGHRQPFVAINCGAIPEGLIESELFGHEKGSFTGATEAKAGLFEVAGAGTLFLDEVGELPPPVQVKLLRALQERKLRRVGGSADLGFSARIVAATNRDLAEEVRTGRFREDLYYRLNVIQLRMPALRERREDLPLFVEHFLARFAEEQGRARPALSPEAERLLLAHGYPGNVRELANVVERALTLCDGGRILPGDLPHALRGAAAPAPAAGAAPALPDAGIDLQAHLDAIERALLEQALERTGGVKTEAARVLSLSFRSLRYRLAKFGIAGR
ncbi:two component, sigma54 specific, transcriptional regulator, Fis family [Anaeromyxobacter dehalogenans 2CP-1]|uniref:Two component, sigma54 specific, transcriptional regulator, Fis family n=1 Tax=Anaeromyxobacter dehalogenans (strain ATCC BAA-258 / DSM 21875 / 2CP-1) TaxID=455488 RepID=B8JCY9_ANAD2|nr:sigma-54 dependent transcriptional regulator [Anaeromyxobacter dehalogenans]ACL64017.1 two component, sigma54 specific, transcriptional regulator, Fis family [Anaeromyxobacter dehalogenans 2CP-1]